MDPSKKPRLIEEDGNGVPLNVSGWDDWELEDKENCSNNAQQRPGTSVPIKTIDLTRWRRCEVKSVTKFDREIHLSLMEDDVAPEKAQTGQLILYDTWISTEINPMDTVSVKAVWSQEQQCHVITRDKGLLVVNPDVLVSGTSLLGSLFCARKGVLGEYFRKITPEVQIMTIGSMVHELLQMCLKKNLETQEQILEECRDLLENQKTIFQIYSATLEAQKAEQEMMNFVPKIYQFIQRYLLNQPMPLFQKWDNFGGTIESVQDIEENIWMPQLGLKGKVDVGVRVRKRTPGGVEVVKTIPMELKTGRATFSLEHRGQLTLYQMMMGEFHRDTESGLLLYLREGILRELQPTWNEVRDLIMMRNKFIGYLASEKIYMNDEDPEFKLPEPISHPTACSSCPLNTICSVFLLKSDQKDLVTPQHYLHKVLEKVTEHLSEMDADYFINWVHIVFYEHFHEHETFSHERIWTKTPEAREVEGFTLAYLVILTNPTLQGNRYVTEFHVDKSRPGGSKRDCLTAGFSLGDYLIVSTSQKIAVATGTVLSIDPWSICLSLERDLRALYRHEVFHIDRFESKMSMTFNLTNLGALLENTERSNELRRLIVEKIPPKGSPDVQRITHEAFWNLNDDQMDAIVKSVHLQEYMLLEGLPGTGKTETIIAIVRYFHRQGKSVLITSHTNAAVDNFLERLIPFDVPFMRLGSVSRISPKLHHYTESFLTRECSTVDDLDVTFYRCGIVGVTCMGCNHPLLIQRQFDLCIVDEATQVFQPTILRPLLSAKKFILVGDPHQLPPLMKSDQALEMGGGESLFKRLQTPESVATLRAQYRMNATITSVANNLSYNGLLSCANDTVANSVIQYAPEMIFSEESTPPWLYKTLSTDLNMAFIYVDTGYTTGRHIDLTKQINIDPSSKVELNFQVDSFPDTNVHHLSTNICEAALCLYIVRSLNELGIDCRDIGIIAPFRAQVILLQQLIVKFNEVFGFSSGTGVEVNTVDQFQGREKSVIIYSCVSNCNTKDHLCEVDKRIMGSSERFAVAMTRAKHKCIIIGNYSSLEFIDPFRNLKQGMLPEGFIRLTNGDLGFKWPDVLRHFVDVYRKNYRLLEAPIFHTKDSFDDF